VCRLIVGALESSFYPAVDRVRDSAIAFLLLGVQSPASFLRSVSSTLVDYVGGSVRRAPRCGVGWVARLPWNCRDGGAYGDVYARNLFSAPLRLRTIRFTEPILNSSERSPWIVMTLLVCLWVIWDGWAAFFMWLVRWITISNTTLLYDFFNIYSQGGWWLSGAYFNPETQVFSYPFSYPPSSLPFFGFFAQFPFGVAAQLWTALGLVVFLIALLSTVTILSPSRRVLFVSIATVLFFTSYGVRAELELGQANLLLAGLTILSLVSYRLKHKRTSATLLVVGTLLKGPPVLFLLYFVLFYRDLRYLLYFAESAVGILAVSLTVIPFQLYSIWLTNIFPTLFVSTGLPINESITGAIALSGLSYLTPSLFVVGVCMFAGFTYKAHQYSFRKSCGPSGLAADAVFLMNSIVVLLLGTRSWPQDYVWVILPVALFLSALLVEGVKTPYFVIVGFAAFLFNFSVHPLVMYYMMYYPPVAYYVSQIEVIPTGLAGDLLMVPALLLLFIHPRTALRNPTTRGTLSGHLKRK
jgi:Glycosyltransferase family 87